MKWPNPPNRILRRKEAVQRFQKDPFREMGEVPMPDLPGIVESPVNLPSETEDVPKRTAVQNQYAHLPPVSIPELTQYLSRDLLGQLRANAAAGNRVFFRDNQQLTTVANQSVTFNWPVIVRHVMVQNNSAVSINVNFDSAASPGKLLIPAGVLVSIDVVCKSVSIYAAAALNIDGDVAGHLFVAGYI